MIAGNTSTRGHRHHRLFFSVPSDFIDNMEGIRHYLAGTIEGPFTLLVLIKESAQGYDTVPWAAIALGAVDESPHPHARYAARRASAQAVLFSVLIVMATRGSTVASISCREVLVWRTIVANVPCGMVGEPRPF